VAAGFGTERGREEYVAPTPATATGNIEMRK
jgi:hypothetical protein